MALATSPLASGRLTVSVPATMIWSRTRIPTTERASSDQPPISINIHPHCLVLDGVYRATAGMPVFHAVRAPTPEELQTLLARIIKRLMNRMHKDVQL